MPHLPCPAAATCHPPQPRSHPHLLTHLLPTALTHPLTHTHRSTGDGELAEFLRKMFGDRFQGLLFTSLQAPDRRQLQEVLVKLNREEKQRECVGGGAVGAQEVVQAGGPSVFGGGQAIVCASATGANASTCPPSSASRGTMSFRRGCRCGGSSACSVSVSPAGLHGQSCWCSPAAGVGRCMADW